MQTLLLPSDKKADICLRMTSLRIVTLIHLFNVTIFEMWISRKYDFYRDWKFPCNGIAVSVVLLDWNFQDKTFSWYVFAIKNAPAADVPGRFASTRTAPAAKLLFFGWYLRCCVDTVYALTAYLGMRAYWYAGMYADYMASNIRWTWHINHTAVNWTMIYNKRSI